MGASLYERYDVIDLGGRLVAWLIIGPYTERMMAEELGPDTSPLHVVPACGRARPGAVLHRLALFISCIGVGIAERAARPGHCAT